MIPNIIYKTAPYLNLSIKMINEELEKQNPGWKVKFYNDKESLNFLKNNFQNERPIFKKNVITAYNTLIPGAYKADLWRLCIIYQYGGVYMDASSRFITSINKIFDLNKTFNIALDNSNKGSGLQIAFFAAIKNHPFLKLYITQILLNIKNKYYGKNSLFPTGPICALNVAQNKHFYNKINIPVILDKGYYKMKINGIIVGKRKSSQHNKLINKNKKNSYGYLWKNKLIYRQ